MRIFTRIAIVLVLLCPGLTAGKPDQPAPPEAKAPDRLTCSWRGVYHYPDGGNESVKFDMIMIRDGANVIGFIKEPNTFGERKEPFLHAVFKGTVDEKTGMVTFTKTYDGTAGPKHDVKYEGKLAGDAAKVEGTWAIGDFEGKFTLERVAQTRSGAFSGVWEGTYKYPENVDKKPVSFKMILIHDGQNVAGFTKETNTFGKREEPWLQAGIKGFFDEKKGKLTFTKTYDGTGGEDHDVTYTGDVSRTKASIEGTWTIGDKASGRFTLKKLRIDAKTIEDLK